MILRRQYVHAPSFVFLIVALVAKAACASEISLGSIIMQFRSTVNANSTQLNERVGNVTTKYLDEYFDAYYSRTEHMTLDYFSGLELSTNSFGVHGAKGSFITTIEIEGTLFFNSAELPSNNFIETLLRNAFMGRNEQLYLDQLLALKDDEFLQNLTYLIIDINKGKVAEIPEDSISATENVDATNISNNDAISSINEEEPGGIKKWVTVVMCIAGVILALVVLLCSYYGYRRYQRGRATKNWRRNADVEPMKVIKLPVKKKQSSSLYPSNKKENEVINNDIISPTSTARTTHSSPGSIADKMDRPPPSPQRSMTSQASSMFTYTDNMSKFTTIKSPSLSSNSKFSLDAPSIDPGMWRGGRQDPPAFGSDISVIEKPKDLSFIPEEQEDIEIGLKNNNKENSRRNISSNQHLSQKPRVTLDARHSMSRYSNRSETYFYKGRQVSNDDSDSDDDDDDGVPDMSTSDVICDLKNLSMQIERERSGRRSKRGLKP